MEHKDRQHYRIKYPVDNRPQLTINAISYVLVDISESGLRAQIDSNNNLQMNQIVEIEIKFTTGSEFNTKATVVRHLGDLCMFRFQTFVPKEILFKEAENLIKQYGNVPTSKY